MSKPIVISLETLNKSTQIESLLRKDPICSSLRTESDGSNTISISKELQTHATLFVDL